MLRHALIGFALALAAGSALAEESLSDCDLRLNVTDTDPNGLNVRDTPNGTVIGALKARNRWVQVHVIGAVNGWMRIDGAIDYDDAFEGGQKTVFSQVGWVAISKLGFETLNPGAELFIDPNGETKVVYQVPMDERRIPKAKILGCVDGYLQVQIGKLIGFTNGFCSNQRTTCS